MRNTLNATACAALLEEVTWGDPSLLASLSVLALINVMVIVGNCLVIAAVFCSSKLRSVTNLFIVSLAVADLMVGVAVLPFSATWEIFKVWIFGDVWCSVWLAVDVWMCTASILNLCAISLDRYVAVTRPITYPSIMSHSRAKMLIAGLWVLSFVICFPPLVGWKDDQANLLDEATNSTRVVHPPCPWKCELTNEAGYVVYSALGSFYIPMFVMLFFYWRIYRAAVRTTRAINQGFRTTKGSRGLGNRFEEQRLTLRIHRGRASMMRNHGHHHHNHGSPHSNGSNSTTTTGSASPSPGRGRHERIKISVSYPSTENLSGGTGNGNHKTSGAALNTSPTSPVGGGGGGGGHATYAVHYSANGKDSTTTTLCSGGGVSRGSTRENQLRVQNSLRLSNAQHRRQSGRSNSCDSSATVDRDLSPSPSSFDESCHKPKIMSRKMGKRNIKAQVKRFRMETKAAKTLGIIVGGFIFCWLPFFTMYLIRAFCPDCIHPLVFSILFWLGYCNSAINPLIYALFSKDFRFAFKKIICKCFCKGTEPSTSRRGSDGSQLQGRQFRSPSCNMQQTANNSLGDDSDPGGEPSESR